VSDTETVNTETVSYSEESESTGISYAAFGATLVILLVIVVVCGVVIVIQHRRIPKELSLLSWFLVKIGSSFDFNVPLQYVFENEITCNLKFYDKSG
jgi:hypothetical protein